MRTFLSSALILSFISVMTYSQKLNTDTNIDENTKINALQSTGDKVEFKNDSGNSLITITDEGSDIGSVTLPSGSTPSTTTNKLYNIGGNLHFNGKTLGTSSSAGGWTDIGAFIHTSTLSDKVGIGTNNPLANLSVGGSGVSGAGIYSEIYGTYGIYGKSTYTGSSTAYGGYFTSSSSSGRGVYGYAGKSGFITNYGGYFQAVGGYGRGVYGNASNTGDFENFGGYFTSSGNRGSGVYGHASGSEGRGVYGEASKTGSVSNYGGYFIAKGSRGTGVYGEATNTSSTANYGGYFKTNSSEGTGLYAISTAPYSKAIYGYCDQEGGIGIDVRGKWLGVRSDGDSYDFYANGPGNDFGSSSSIRWKKNIIEINSPLDKLSKLRGVYFDWDEEHGGRHDVGMIAEEVGEVLPEIVVYEENGIDAEGMDYSKLTPLLVEAVKAQQAMIIKLNHRIEQLEGR